jgi:hypothetical protein
LIIDRAQLAPAVAFIRQPLPGGAASAGTGFFVQTDRLYLVSAAHVTSPLQANAEIIISEAQTSKPLVLGWKELVQSSATPVWITHADADIAVLPLNPTDAIMNGPLAGRFLPLSLIPDKQIAPPRDTLLTLMGYPVGLGVTGHVSPLTLDTRPASGLITLPRFDTKQPCSFFMLQDPAMGGYSGCPVFDVSVYRMGAMTTTGGGTVCWGITHGTIPDQTGGKLAAITPSYYLRDLI